MQKMIFTIIAVLMLAFSGIAIADIGVDISYDRYRDVTSYKVQCFRKLQQRNKLCIGMTVGVDGKIPTIKNIPDRVWNFKFHLSISELFTASVCEVRHNKNWLRKSTTKPECLQFIKSLALIADKVRIPLYSKSGELNISLVKIKDSNNGEWKNIHCRKK